MRKGYIHYPLAESHSATLNYMDSIDWDKICDNIHKNGVTYFDVSNAIDIFPHLERDKNYSLICYVSSEYHGLWGRVAAVRNCCDRRPRIIQNGHFFGTLFDFPRYAFDPMEAVFNDGTPEGYLEALILSELLSAIPYSRHERDNRDAFISTLLLISIRTGISMRTFPHGRHYSLRMMKKLCYLSANAILKTALVLPTVLTLFTFINLPFIKLSHSCINSILNSSTSRHRLN